jgi:predicted chitinase
MLTPDQLRRIMPNLPAVKAETLLPHLNSAMAEFGIDTMLRTAAFAAQLAHESGEFRWMEEIWGPTSAQKRYEPQTDLSQRLGNTEGGDGLRFKGRGPIQLTGRANYARFGGLLGIDLVGSPEQAAAPEVAFRIAALFWKNRGLNELAEAGDFREVTRRINGGFNGFDDRLKYYERAKSVLAVGFQPGTMPVTRGARRARVDVPQEPLQRGAEAIEALAPARRRPPTTAGKKAAVKKGAAKKAAPKQVAAKKGAAKKGAAKKVAGKKAAPKKVAAKKGVAKQVAATAKAKPAAGKKAAASPKPRPARKASARGRATTPPNR